MHWDFGYCNQDDIVEVTTLEGNAVDVRLLDDVNFRNYKLLRRYRHYGRFVRQSPARFIIPYGARWHLAIDVGERRVRIKAEAGIIRG